MIEPMKRPLTERTTDQPIQYPNVAIGPDERRVLPPRLVGVQRQAARLLGEHGRELGVDGVDEDGDDGGDAPQHRCAPATEIADREAERAEQEARIRERDHEAVVPAKRLEELLFLDYCCRHINLRRSAVNGARGAALRANLPRSSGDS